MRRIFIRFMKGVIFTTLGMSIVAPTSSNGVRRTGWMAGPTVKPFVKGGATLPPVVAFLPAFAGGTEGAVPLETGAGVAALAAGFAGVAKAGAGALASGLAALAAGLAGATLVAGLAGALAPGLAGALAGIAGALAAGLAGALAGIAGALAALGAGIGAFFATGFAGFEGGFFFTGAVVFLATLPFAETFFAAAFKGLAGALVAAFGLTLACGFAGLPLAAGFCGLARGLAGGDFFFGAGLLAGLAVGFLTGLAGAFVALGLAGLMAFFAVLDFAGIARGVLLNQSFFDAFSGETDHGVRRQKWARSLPPDSTGCNHYSEFIHNPASRPLLRGAESAYW